MVFHLHKNRNFLRKIELQEVEEKAKKDNEERLRVLIETSQANVDEVKAMKVFRRMGEHDDVAHNHNHSKKHSD